jgi:hypothetical protein
VREKEIFESKNNFPDFPIVNAGAKFISHFNSLLIAIFSTSSFYSAELFFENFQKISTSTNKYRRMSNFSVYG